ncbi:glycosyltransferase family 2 protein [Pararhodonellum marinum]|uniref:glycosyltransferase family 2 protein n=1 Tax=Pararhodonellum marinum TaxID=2755358 RepID=UPI0018902B32|nr:glycosyltransferase family 2 protein [Pararhodonellum marinum]
MKIAVLIASFNRKNKTLKCLETLVGQILPENVELEIFLTDDHSTDGTAEAVKSQFPQVHLFDGTGSLFWAGGMRNTWTKALECDPDFFLLVNDDTFLYPNSVERILRDNKNHLDKTQIATISVGATIDPKTGQVSYGGHKLHKEGKPQFYLIHDEKHNVDCDLGCANFMLVPKEIVSKIGILSEKFTHMLADFDYTLRAKKAGFNVVSSPGIHGTCTNDHGNNWKSPQTSLKERLAYLNNPKGLAYKEYLYYIKTHFPKDIPSSTFKLWLKTLAPTVYDKFKKV